MTRNQPAARPLKYNRRNSASIDRYAKEVDRIWHDRNEVRPVLCQWLGVVNHTTRIAEEVRRWSWHRIAHEIGNVFVWWLSFVERLSQEPADDSELDLVFYINTTPTEVIWSKFPNLCPVCFGIELSDIIGNKRRTIRESGQTWARTEVSDTDLKKCYKSVTKKPCKCLANKELVEIRSDDFKKWTKEQIFRVGVMKLADTPTSLKELETSIRDIFAPTVEVLTPDQIAFHLLEEVGEVSDALLDLYLQPMTSKSRFLNERKVRINHLVEELADVFSWTVSMLNTTNDVLDCAAKFVKEEYKDTQVTGIDDVISMMLSPTKNLVDLTWHIFGLGQKNILVCDHCKLPVCEPTHSSHVRKSGNVLGKDIAQWKDEIMAM